MVPSKKAVNSRHRRTIRSVLVLAIAVSLAGCVANGVPSMSDPSNSETAIDNPQAGIVVVPASDGSVSNNTTVVDASTEPYNEISSLQDALREAEETNNRSSSPIAGEENTQFVEATKNIPRSEEPGVYIRYNDRLYRAYIKALT